jgi:hypothetical protein
MDCFVALLLAMTVKTICAAQMISVSAAAFDVNPRQIDPTGKSLPIYGNRVKPRNKKYFAFPEGRTVAYDRHPVPIRGAYHDRHERGTGSGGRW